MFEIRDRAGQLVEGPIGFTFRRFEGESAGMQFDFAEHLLTAAFTQTAGDGVFFFIRDAFGKSSFFALPGGLAEFREEGLET